MARAKGRQIGAAARVAFGAAVGAAVGTVAIAGLVPLQAAAKDFTEFNIFGDSLMDAGNLFNLTRVPPSPPYDGKLSNGPIWVEQLAGEFGLSPALATEALPGIVSGTAPFPTEGINFAFGGSLSSDVNVGGPPLPGLQQQIGAYSRLATVAPPDPDALFLLLAGGNDYNDALFNPTSSALPLDGLAERVTDNLAGAAAALIEAGAQHLLIGNLPDLGAQPFADTLDRGNPQSSALLSALSAEHNLLLDRKLDALESSSTAKISQLALDNLLADIIDRPGDFGFQNVEDSCLINFQPGGAFDGICDSPDSFFFWDDVHPTTAGHGAIAQLAKETLTAKEAEAVPEPGSILGIVATFGGAAVYLRRKGLLDRRAG